MKIILFFITTAVTLGTAKFSNAQTLPSYLPTDGLVGWWPFNGNANDESGNGNHGTVNGATLTQDRFGNATKAYFFNGSSNNISIPHSELLNFQNNNSFTLSYWVHPLTISSSQASVIMSKQTGYSTFQNGWNSFIEPNQKTNFYIRNGSGQPVSGCNFGVISPNANYHIVHIFTNGLAQVYLNGILEGETTSSGVIVGNVNVPLLIGQASWVQSNTTGYNGTLDDIAIYNRALTPEEITALYTSTPINSGGGNNNSASTNVPQGISYQAVARNAQGQPLSNTALQVKFTLLADSLTGTAEYTELHSLTTNDLGLFTTAFGTGTPLSGTFSNINWAGGNKFVKIEADQGSGFIEMGTQQMLSVPYSIRSQTSAAIQNNGLPVFANNAAALAGGLQAGQMYRTGAGVLMVVY